MSANLRRLLTRTAAAAGAGAALIGASALTTEAHASTATTRVVNALRGWEVANEGLGHTGINLTTALAAARSYDLITALPGQYAPYLAQMRAANPRLKVLEYLNGMYALRGQGTMYPASWYATDTHGNRVRSHGYGNWLMNPANPGWVANRASECKAAVAAGYDGCMLDMLGPAPLMGGYDTALPYDPATHANWTAAAWSRATDAVEAAARAAVGRHFVLGNGLGSGAAFFAPNGTSSLLGAGPGIAEEWIRQASAPATAFPTSASWLDGIRMLVAAGAQQRRVAVDVKLWGPGTPAQKAAWATFAVGSFLLGTNGCDYISVGEHGGDVITMAGLDKLDIGAPVGSYVEVSPQLFERTFTGGTVLVNPSGNASRASVHGAARVVGATPQAGSVTVPAHRAVFLLG